MSGAAGALSPPARRSTLRGLLALSRPWLAEPRTMGAILLLLVLTSLQTGLAVASNIWSASLFDALDARDAGGLWLVAGQFLLLLAGIVTVNAGHMVVRRSATLSWRRALTTQLLARWLDHGRHWRIGQIPGSPDNPDGRIAEDIRIATEAAMDLATSLFFSVTLLISFTGILWSLSGDVELFGVSIPGRMVWLSLIYAAGGAVVAFVIGRPLTRWTELRQRAEADLRFGMARVREHEEELAVARGEAAARGDLLRRFAALALTWRRQTVGLVNLAAFQSAFVTVAPVLPLLVAAPRYLAGRLSLGELMQLSLGFQQVVAALAWPVDNAARLAEWRASADRVLLLAEAVEHAEATPGGIRIEEDGAAMVLDAVTLSTPEGVPLTGPLQARLPPGTHVGVVGDPRAVRALFLAVSGLWLWGDGRIGLPFGHRLAVLPRRPWLPAMSLARLLGPPAGTSHEVLTAVLNSVGLARLVPQLEQTPDWDAVLDDSERLRLAFARVVLARPGIVLLADMAGILGEEELRRLIGLLLLAIPHAIVLSADAGAAEAEIRLDPPDADDAASDDAPRAPAKSPR
ncbi:SbmA/BacA-like family transporter [Roseomonas sp. AR75]|uniref:ABC transporter ATP-binding protein/permease n=1 Tax=Roseomonas sp. AR75 TaxID=2562311 RepID=UPI0010C085B7|nr:SbmA/BacA-like family transporter [Roseomonas sp. AR75]